MSGVESSKKDESNATKLSNMSVQYYYKIKPMETKYQKISAQNIIDNIDTDTNIRKPYIFLYDYEIIGKVITRKIKHMVSSLEAFIILKETENPADNNKKITHFMGLNFNKELTIDKNPTLYNHLFGVPEFEITDDKLNLKYTIYNKRFYDDI
jgi:5S rRNA maturation endonuclease (ribonuclease M5)